MNATFDTMLDFFTPTADVVTKECEDCGATFEVSIRQSGKALRCRECQREYRKKYSREYKERNTDESTQSIGDPYLDFVLAVIRQGKRDAQAGRKGALEWLHAEDGARLWVRAVGVSLDDDMEKLFNEL